MTEIKNKETNMPTAYVGPGWENPERTKIFGGSLADVYIRDGFTVASIVEAGHIDRERVRKGLDIAIFLPTDEHRSTPNLWVRDLDEAEKYLTRQRELHPEWPTEPVPRLIGVPRFKLASAARTQVEEIVAVLEDRDFNLHGEGVWNVALGIYVHCQGDYIEQTSIDRAQLLRAVVTDLKD